MNKVTIKNLKIMEEMSEETTCFHLTLYVNNKKIGTVSNHGYGGCNDYHFKEHKMKVELESLAFDYVKEHNLLKNYSNEMQGEFALEYMIDHLIDYKISENDLRKKMRTDMILKNTDCSKGEFYFFSKKKLGVNRYNIVKKCTELASASFTKFKSPKILNGMGTDQAIKLWHEETVGATNKIFFNF